MTHHNDERRPAGGGVHVGNDIATVPSKRRPTSRRNAQRTNVQRTSTAICCDCWREWDGRNALAVGAIHAVTFGHAVDGAVTAIMTFVGSEPSRVNPGRHR